MTYSSNSYFFFNNCILIFINWQNYYVIEVFEVEFTILSLWYIFKTCCWACKITSVIAYIHTRILFTSLYDLRMYMEIIWNIPVWIVIQGFHLWSWWHVKLPCVYASLLLKGSVSAWCKRRRALQDTLSSTLCNISGNWFAIVLSLCIGARNFFCLSDAL